MVAVPHILHRQGEDKLAGEDHLDIEPRDWCYRYDCVNSRLHSNMGRSVVPLKTFYSDMYIAKKLREQNICEYLIYMWQIEDIIRAYKFDIDALKDN